MSNLFSCVAPSSPHLLPVTFVPAASSGTQTDIAHTASCDGIKRSTRKKRPSQPVQYQTGQHRSGGDKGRATGIEMEIQTGQLKRFRSLFASLTDYICSTLWSNEYEWSSIVWVWFNITTIGYTPIISTFNAFLCHKLTGVTFHFE